MLFWIAVVIAAWFCLVVLTCVGLAIWSILAAIFGWDGPLEGGRTGGIGNSTFDGASGTTSRD